MAHKTTIVIGPVGSGKSSLIKAHFIPKGYRHEEVDKYVGVHGDDKNARLWRNVRIELERGDVVIDNGGGLFTGSITYRDGHKVDQGPFLKGISLGCVVAPQELVEFAAKFSMPSQEVYTGSIVAFGDVGFWKSAWARCNDETGPCGQFFKGLVAKFEKMTVDACDWRVREGIFHLGYAGSKFKFGHFASEKSMHEIMAVVTKRNFEHQIKLLLWARAAAVQIKGFQYNEDHSVTLL